MLHGYKPAFPVSAGWKKSGTKESQNLAAKIWNLGPYEHSSCLCHLCLLACLLAAARTGTGSSSMFCVTFHKMCVSVAWERKGRR